MLKRFAAVMLLVTSLINLLPEDIYASSPNIVISSVQAGADSSIDNAAMAEAVIIYNNSDQDIEITDWCIENKSLVKFACFSPSSQSVHFWLKARNYSIISSSLFSSVYNSVADITYIPTNNVSGNIVSSTDTIMLVDKNSTVIDSISWQSSLAAGYNYTRQFIENSTDTMKDTDQLDDFTRSNQLTVPPSGLYEVVIIIDQCPNIDLVQESLPVGYLLDEYGECVIDTCPNLSGLQTYIPEGMEQSADGSCVYVDLCVNIQGSQSTVPTGYYIDEHDNCFVTVNKLKVTELMPNPDDRDAGSEFIELYNPNDYPVSLDLYKFVIGIDSLRSYSFPIGDVVQPKSFYLLYNSNLNFNLNNTGSKLSVQTIDNQTVDYTDSYLNARDGQAWALIDNIWQFTNQPTPGSDNIPTIESEVEIVSNLVPCGPGQYRNPETNRCRSIINQTTTLKPCKDGEYRSEETGRCRSILGASTTDSQPCPEGQYRNPETNRCKKVVVPVTLEHPSNLVSEVSSEYSGMIVLLIVSIFLLGYGVYEWRDEIVRAFRFIKKRLVNYN